MEGRVRPVVSIPSLLRAIRDTDERGAMERRFTFSQKLGWRFALLVAHGARDRRRRGVRAARGGVPQGRGHRRRRAAAGQCRAAPRDELPEGRRGARLPHDERLRYLQAPRARARRERPSSRHARQGRRGADAPAPRGGLALEEEHVDAVAAARGDVRYEAGDAGCAARAGGVAAAGAPQRGGRDQYIARRGAAPRDAAPRVDGGRVRAPSGSSWASPCWVVLAARGRAPARAHPLAADRRRGAARPELVGRAAGRRRAAGHRAPSSRRPRWPRSPPPSASCSPPRARSPRARSGWPPIAAETASAARTGDDDGPAEPGGGGRHPPPGGAHREPHARARPEVAADRRRASRSSTSWRSRPTSSPSTPPSRRPARARRAGASRWSPRRSASSPTGWPARRRTSARSSTRCARR